MAARNLFIFVTTACVLALPGWAQIQAGSGSSRVARSDQSASPQSSSPRGSFPIAMAPPPQSIPTGYGADPFQPVYTNPSTTQARLDPGSGSLWSEGSFFNSPFDFEPVNTYNVGDHIIVKVEDNFRSKEDARYKNEIKNADIDLNVKRFLWHDFTKVNNNPFLNIDVEAKEKYDGTSRGDITSVLTLDIPTEVKRIFPDGRLLLEGRTSRIIGRDIRQVLITGIAQPDDIDYNSKTVEGSRVLDMQVKWEGNGPGPNVLKPGFFHRFLDYVPLF